MESAKKTAPKPEPPVRRHTQTRPAAWLSPSHDPGGPLVAAPAVWRCVLPGTVAHSYPAPGPGKAGGGVANFTLIAGRIGQRVTQPAERLRLGRGALQRDTACTAVAAPPHTPHPTQPRTNALHPRRTLLNAHSPATHTTWRRPPTTALPLFNTRLAHDPRTRPRHSAAPGGAPTACATARPRLGSATQPTPLGAPPRPCLRTLRHQRQRTHRRLTPRHPRACPTPPRSPPPPRATPDTCTAARTTHHASRFTRGHRTLPAQHTHHASRVAIARHPLNTSPLARRRTHHASHAATAPPAQHTHARSRDGSTLERRSARRPAPPALNAAHLLRRASLRGHAPVAATARRPPAVKSLRLAARRGDARARCLRPLGRPPRSQRLGPRPSLDAAAFATCAERTRLVPCSNFAHVIKDTVNIVAF